MKDLRAIQAAIQQMATNHQTPSDDNEDSLDWREMQANEVMLIMKTTSCCVTPS